MSIFGFIELGNQYQNNIDKNNSFISKSIYD